MQIIFGWKLDGPCHPLTATASAAAIGQPVVGPHGLLGLLEAPLGLAGPSTPAAVRIARYQGRLRGLDDGARFYLHRARVCVELHLDFIERMHVHHSQGVSMDGESCV